MVMFSKELKKALNERVIRDCRFNGKEIVADRMKVRTYQINKVVWNGLEFVEEFTGDDYDLQQRESELQKTVQPVGRIKYFKSVEVLNET